MRDICALSIHLDGYGGRSIELLNFSTMGISDCESDTPNSSSRHRRQIKEYSAPSRCHPPIVPTGAPCLAGHHRNWDNGSGSSA